MQGDIKATETVLGVTRNSKYGNWGAKNNYYRVHGGLNDANRWKYSHRDTPYGDYWGWQSNIKWSGNVNNPTYNAEFYGPGNQVHSMTGLAENEANWVLAGGSTAQGSASEYNDQMARANANYQEGHATAPGLNLMCVRPAQY